MTPGSLRSLERADVAGLREGQPVPAAQPRQRSTLRLLALVPPDQQGSAASRYSFLSEELRALSAREVDVHTVSAYVPQTVKCGAITIHPLPGFLHISQTVRGASSLLQPQRRQLLRSASWAETLRLARHQLTIESLIRAQGIDLIYSPFAWPAGTAGVPAGLSTNVPVVMSLRGVDALCEPEIGYGRLLDEHYSVRFRAALDSTTHVIAVSQALADVALALGCSPERVSVILKGIDTSRFSPGPTEPARKRLALPNRPTILFVGNFVPAKGVEVLVGAFQILKTEMPDTQLVLCGDGPEQETIRKRVNDAGLESDVFLPGRISREAIADYFRAADVFVLPSLTEGSGNVLVESGSLRRTDGRQQCRRDSRLYRGWNDRLAVREKQPVGSRQSNKDHSS